uniref:cGMP-dependent protein kinase n=1 Tax=Ditylum brightwellii TaxID=49249 RepID=A0A7S2E854_9STRA
MGCSQSKRSTDAAITSKKRGSGDQNGDDFMSNAEIQSRIESIEETKKATFGGLSVRYAYLTQRGYYPDDAHKPNQDAYSVTHPFEEKETDAFFGVYDGHGRDGDKCAQYVRDNLPQLVTKYVIRAKMKEKANTLVGDTENNEVIQLKKEQIQAACQKAHIECNRGIRRNVHIDDSLSGTTAVSVYLHGERNRMTVCNVGDSRAILGQMIQRNGKNDGEDDANPSSSENGNSSSLRAQPLSRDQTPYRRDERVRIRAAGGRILSLDQLEGLEPVNNDDEEMDKQWDNNDDSELVLGEELDEGGDPPRVWSPHGEYPGTAFTRSLGDAIAEELGVFAEPEMITRDITSQDKIIVLASDGVFEFLTNQSVIDICAKFSDPLEACRAVVAESYELWLQYELRTDDITMICIFVDDVASDNNSVSHSLYESENTAPGDEASAKVAFDLVDGYIPVEGSKPVRNRLSKEKSQALEKMKTKLTKNNGELEDLENVDINELITEKSSEEKAHIAEAIRASVMFQNITDIQREMIFGVMESIPVKKGEWVIRQDTVGDRFYIVDDGKFDVRIVPDGETDTRGDGGNIVHVYDGSRENHAHPSFGELALMYSAPRAASIIAQTDGHLWALHRFAFRKVLLDKPERKELVQVLQRLTHFKDQDEEELKNVADSMEEITYGSGDTIVKQGDAGDCFFVISSGHCECTQEENNGEEIRTELKIDEYFGEEVLSGADEYYKATLKALSTTTCWKLEKASLKKTMASFRYKRNKVETNIA